MDKQNKIIIIGTNEGTVPKKKKIIITKVVVQNFEIVIV